MWVRLLCMGVAGALGTLARYGLSGLIARTVGSTFPWGTALVNILGCLLFGLLWAALETRLAIQGPLRMMIFVGFFGAFTTFSTFAFETSRLMEDSQWIWAVGNVLLQTGLGLIAMVAGVMLGKCI